jgi:hypothetical protein
MGSRVETRRASAILWINGVRLVHSSTEVTRARGVALRQQHEAEPRALAEGLATVFTCNCLRLEV